MGCRTPATSRHFNYFVCFSCSVLLVCLLSVWVVPSLFCFVSEVVEDSLLAAPGSVVVLCDFDFLVVEDCCSFICVLLSSAKAGAANPTNASKEKANALWFLLPPLIHD